MTVKMSIKPAQVGAPHTADEWRARVRKDDQAAALALVGSVVYLSLAVTGFAWWLGWLG